MRALLAQKMDMTHIFDEAGNFVPVTVLLASKNVVTQVKTAEKDGYTAVQIGFGEKKKLARPQAGHVKKAKISPKVLSEITAEDGKKYEVGQEIPTDLFSEGEIVDVQGVSKGKGFAGTVKRHNFNTGPKTHGSHNYRAPGSIGAGYPQHVMKGQKLPGRMGAAKTTVKNLVISKIDKEEGIILVRGAVPGPKKGIVLLTESVKNKKKEEKKDK